MNLNPKLKKTINLYKEYLDNNQREDTSPSDIIYNLQPKIIDEKILKTFSNGDKLKKEDNNNDTIVYNNENEKEISDTNKNYNSNIINENNININKEEMIKNNENSSAIRIPDDIAKKNFGNNKFLDTLMSVTSKEFREGCPGPDSFFSTMKFDDMNGTQKTNGLKEIQNVYIGNIIKP